MRQIFLVLAVPFFLALAACDAPPPGDDGVPPVDSATTPQ